MKAWQGFVLSSRGRSVWRGGLALGIFLVGAGMGGGASASGQESGPSSEKVQMFHEAVDTAAQIDAYEAYCKTAKANHKISDQILEAATKRGVAAAAVAELRSGRDKGLADKLEALKSEGSDCKNVDFLFGKYVLVQKLDGQTAAIVDLK